MADPYTELSDRLEDLLVKLVDEKAISLDVSGLILTTVNIELKNIQMDMEVQIQKKITDWEASMGEEDKTLYSLGLRHALDIVTGVVPTDPKPAEESDDEE